MTNERQLMQACRVLLNFSASAFSKKVTSLILLDKFSAKGKKKTTQNLYIPWCLHHFAELNTPGFKAV